MPEDADVAALLSRGGWQLTDPQPAHRANPEGFWLPSAEQLAKLTRGSSVRAIFAVLDQADIARDGYGPYDKKRVPQLAVIRERMWSFVERIDGQTLHCILMNRPYASHTDLTDGARFTLPMDHVIDLSFDGGDRLDEMLAHVTPLDDVTQPVDRKRAPRIPEAQLAICKRKRVKPHRPSVFSQMLVTKNLAETSDPIYGVRSEPRHEENDVGWTVWTGAKDMNAAAKKSGAEVIRVQQITERNRRVFDYLALPPGWGFILGKNGYEDIYRLEE